MNNQTNPIPEPSQQEPGVLETVPNDTSLVPQQPAAPLLHAVSPFAQSFATAEEQPAAIIEQTQQEPGILEQIAQAIFPQQAETQPEEAGIVPSDTGLVPQQPAAPPPHAVSPFAQSFATAEEQPAAIIEQTYSPYERSTDRFYIEGEVHTPVFTGRVGYEHENETGVINETKITTTNS